MNTPRVLFFAPYGTYTVHHQLDAVVASALRLRGAEVVVIRCDGVLPVCDQHAWEGDRDSVCSNCKSCGDPFFHAFGLDTFQLRSALTESDIATAEAWVGSLDPQSYALATFSGVPMGNWCTSSLFSYYRITPAALLDSEMRAATANTHKRLLATGVLTHLALGRIIDHVKPTHLFCFNARYATYRVAFETARAAGVEVITHERGYADGTFTLFANYGSIQTQPAFDGYQVWKDVPLAEDELIRVKRYFANREQGTDSNFEPFIDFSTEYTDVRSLLRIPAEARMVGVFTSSEYEFALCKDYESFVDQLELIERLMLVFKDRPDDYLVIRHHPYLAGNASSPPDLGFIRRAQELANSAPPNVRVIMPGEKINSYALINNLDAAISFLSTAGVEAVARGVATASFKESIYRDALSAIIEDDGRVYLNSLIDDLIRKTSAFGVADLRRLYRFQSMFISRLSHSFETFTIKDTYSADVKVEKLLMLVEGGDQALERVCDHVFKGTPLLQMPTSDQISNTTVAEESFLSGVLSEVRDLRARVREGSRVQVATFTEPPVEVFCFDNIDLEPAWAPISRHRNVQHTALPVVAGLTYNDLANTIAQSSAEFVAISSPTIEYDQSFFSGGVALLKGGECSNNEAVLSGAWIRHESGRMVDQIFSKRTPNLSLERLRIVWPLLKSEPAHLLSLSLFRKETAVSLLRSLGSIPVADKDALEPMYQWLCREQVIRAMGHGVIVKRCAS